MGLHEIHSSKQRAIMQKDKTITREGGRGGERNGAENNDRVDWRNVVKYIRKWGTGAQNMNCGKDINYKNRGT